MKQSDIEKNRRRTFLKAQGVMWYIKAALYAIALVSSLYSFKQYNITLISFGTTFFIWIISGLVSSLILERNYKNYPYSITAFGLVFLWIFFLTNSVSSADTTRIAKFGIKYRSYNRSGRSSGPFVTIDYNGFEKAVYVNVNSESELNADSRLILALRKGGLGYEIIEDRALEK